MKRAQRRCLQQWVPVVISVALGTACGSKKSSSDSTDEDTDTLVSKGGVGTTAGGSDSFNFAYPSALALSFFPTSKGMSLNLAAEQATEGAAASQPMRQKKQEAEKRLKGEGDCLPSSLGKKPPNEGSETCYEFDQDMIYGSRDGTSYIGTRNGQNTKGEACLPAFARTRVDFVADMVDRATGMIQAMFCQAKKADSTLALPANGQSIDMLSALQSALGDKATKISKAKMSRESANDAEGNPVFVSEVEMVDMNGNMRAIALVHSPKSNGDYVGTLINGVVNTSGMNPQDSNKVHYVTVAYSKTTDSGGQGILNYELRSARIHEDIDDAFDDHGQLDFNANADFSVGSQDPSYGRYKKADGSYFAQSNDAISGITYIVASVNPDDNTGTFLYSQNPGGNYSEAARGMVASLSLDGAGALGGCAVSGAVFSGTGQGVSIRKSLHQSATLEPTGFYHPFLNTAGSNSGATQGSDSQGSYYTRTETAGNQTINPTWYKPNTSDATNANTYVTAQTGSLVTRQCFTLANGKYDISTAEIPDGAGYQLIATNTPSPHTIKPPKAVEGVKPPNTH